MKTWNKAQKYFLGSRSLKKKNKPNQKYPNKQKRKQHLLKQWPMGVQPPSSEWIKSSPQNSLLYLVVPECFTLAALHWPEDHTLPKTEWNGFFFFQNLMQTGSNPIAAHARTAILGWNIALVMVLHIESYACDPAVLFCFAVSRHRLDFWSHTLYPKWMLKWQQDQSLGGQGHVSNLAD